MDKKVFVIEDYGDPSVGIWGFTATVTLDDPIGYDEEDIEAMKKMFADHYDVPVCQVFTKEEYDIMREEMEKMERKMEKISLEAAKAEEELIEHMKHCPGCPVCSLNI